MPGSPTPRHRLTISAITALALLSSVAAAPAATASSASTNTPMPATVTLNAAAHATAATGVASVSPASFSMVPQHTAGFIFTAKKPAKPKVNIIPGSKRLTVKWPKVSGASKYQVVYSLRKDFKGAKKVTTKTTAKSLTKLKKGKVYYVKVRALKGKVASGYSKAIKVKTVSATPATVSVKAVPAGVNKIKVTWSQPARAESLKILVSHNNKALEKSSTRFTVSAPVHKNSAIVTIPSSWRSKIGDGSGNPAFVRVLVTNAGKTKKTKITHTYTTARSAKGTSAQKLRFAAYNVGSVAATKNLAGRSWTQRQAAVVRAVERSKADVIAFQELTTAPVNGTDSPRQYLALAKALAPTYKSALTEAQVGTAPGATTKGAHIFYNPTKVRKISSGLHSTKAVTSVPYKRDSTTNETVKYFAWAYMENIATKDRFYVVSLHIPKGTSAEAQRLRLGITEGVNKFIAAKSGGKTLPVVIMGDLNTDVARYPNGATTWLAANGYYSAAHAKKRVNMGIGTTNNQTAKTDGGYPRKPFKYAYVGTRIDHIFIKNSPGSSYYENQAVLNSDGSFNDAFRGSDHNLQVAQLSVAN
ncbi:endonuclease/exonuclease/phosphatase family protein [Jonesia quinghaiensis]|uniref:endonuclease/exonuclease/phosphatase family protein n=1 Tax=Jonesia quinghaiensis TaxID=262806 RepID=UPI00041A7A97|nr:endonuclease/exonuclease/phosphatase family protein [Jonesia quinghaiensis]